jgi:4-hydroxy-2-oxoheptanedioate aldolase
MNKIRAIWAEGRAAILGWLHIPSVISAEALSRCGYDGLVVDLQHGAAGFESMVPMLMAIEAGGAEPFVRVRHDDPAEIMKAMDFGAYGVIAPMIDTADHARAFASALHYPPQGARSFGPRRPLLRYGEDYVSQASASVVSLAMIETAAGLANLDAILAVEGYDGVFIGPGDLSLALGRPPRADPEDPVVVEAIEHIRARCKAAGKRVGLFCVEPAYARRMINAGFDLVSIAPDLTLLTRAAQRTVRETRSPSA